MTTARENWFPQTLVGQLELLVKVGLIAGGVIAVVQYFEARQEQRVARTLAFVDRFESDPVRGARHNLVNAFRAVAPMVSRLETLELSPAAADQVEGAITEYLSTQAAEGAGLVSEIDTVVSFFEGLHACLRAELCDASTAETFFGPYARDLERNLRPYIARVRENRAPQFASGLELLAESGAPVQTP